MAAINDPFGSFASFAGLGGGAGALGAAFPWGALAMALGPTLLSPLMSGFDPAKRREQSMQNIMSEGNYNRLREMLLRNILNSAGYASASRGIQAGAANSRNIMSSNLARAGLGSSGIGAIAPGIAAQAFSQNRAKLAMSAEGLADNRAGQMQQGQMQALGGSPLPTNYFANLLGAGFNAFGPIMGSWARKRYDLPSWNGSGS